MAAPVIFDGRAGRFRWPRRSFSMAAPVGFDGRAGHFRWSFSMASFSTVIFDGLYTTVPMKHSRILRRPYCQEVFSIHIATVLRSLELIFVWMLEKKYCKAILYSMMVCITGTRDTYTTYNCIQLYDKVIIIEYSQLIYLNIRLSYMYVIHQYNYLEFNSIT